MDKNLYDLPPEEAKIPQVTGSLEELDWWIGLRVPAKLVAMVRMKRIDAYIAHVEDDRVV